MINLPDLAASLWPYIADMVTDRINQLRSTPTQNDRYGAFILSVKEQDGNPNVLGVREIRVPNNSLTSDGGGAVSLSYITGGITVQETDGAPVYTGITTIGFDGAIVTNPSAGVVAVTISGGGSNGYGFHVNSADLGVGVLAVRWPVASSESLSSVRFNTNATCSFNMLVNGASQGTVNASGVDGSASVSASVVAGNYVGVQIVSVTTPGNLSIRWS